MTFANWVLQSASAAALRAIASGLLARLLDLSLRGDVRIAYR